MHRCHVESVRTLDATRAASRPHACWSPLWIDRDSMPLPAPSRKMSPGARRSRRFLGLGALRSLEQRYTTPRQLGGDIPVRPSPRQHLPNRRWGNASASSAMGNAVTGTRPSAAVGSAAQAAVTKRSVAARETTIATTTDVAQASAWTTTQPAARTTRSAEPNAAATVAIAARRQMARRSAPRPAAAAADSSAPAAAATARGSATSRVAKVRSPEEIVTSAPRPQGSRRAPAGSGRRVCAPGGCLPPAGAPHG